MSDFVIATTDEGGEGFSPVGAIWGDGATATRVDHALVGGHGADPAWSTDAWRAPRKVVNRCAHRKTTGDKCHGSRVTGRSWCAGHSNALRKLGLDPDEVTAWPSE